MTNTNERAGDRGDLPRPGDVLRHQAGTGALSFYTERWLGGRNAPGRTLLDASRDDADERQEMLDAFDAACAAGGEDEWDILERAALAVREVKAWYGR